MNNNPYKFSNANKELRKFISSATRNGASYIHVTPKAPQLNNVVGSKFSSYDLLYRTKKFKLNF